MCRRVNCKKCGKPTFAGCGMHVEQVLGDVPRAKRCRCAEERKESKGAKGAKAPAPAPEEAPKAWWKFW